MTSATAIMYAFAPIALHALRLRDPGRPRPYRLGAYQVLAPIAFISSNLIIYWSSFQAQWKLDLAILLGLILFTITRLMRRSEDRSPLRWLGSAWVWPWLGGMTVIGWLGCYGGDKRIPEWWDIAAVVAFSMVIYVIAVRVAVSSEEVGAAVAAEEAEIAAEPDLSLP